ncbi:MAG: 3-hexulose-6-phosphate synthase [Candidatus Altiarchaeota archaeon]|nr:3-hexulose-6-phosphate synthase [Candidatus Altiarchaeota archaeon]
MSERMKPVLQVALDFLNLKRAVKVAEESVAGGVDWIEVGTPLIKSEGLDSVREIKRLFPDHKIVADMKVMDTGRMEVEAAAKAGADIAIVLGVADDGTIREAVEAGRNYGCGIMVDLMDVKDMVKRAKEVESLGVDYVCIHLGIDQQMTGLDVISGLSKVSREINISLAVAGGINSETAVKAVNSGARVIIVGGAITKAGDAEEATRLIKNSIESGRGVETELYKKYTDPVKAFMKVSTANISDAMHRGGEMRGIKALTGYKMVGTAVTVRTYPGDWAKPVEAIDSAKKGDVLVIDAGGTGDAVWGELASWSCKKKNVSGVVIDGSIRDSGDITGIKFPAFAKSVTPTAGEPRGFGEINIPITCGNIPVKPGDYVIGDSDGVVVVPKDKAVEIANRALDVMERENRIRGEIKKGSTLSKVMELGRWEKVG